MRYEEGSYEGEVNEAKNPEGQVRYSRQIQNHQIKVSTRWGCNRYYSTFLSAFCLAGGTSEGITIYTLFWGRLSSAILLDIGRAPLSTAVTMRPRG